MQNDYFNDLEIKDSLLFLVDSREEKISHQAKPIDPKKNCFIPDEKNVYIDAVIQTTNQLRSTVEVKTSKGEV